MAYVAAQSLGGLAGGYLATRLWSVAPSRHGGMGWAGFGSEFAASAGLMLIVFGCSRSGRADTGPFAVGAWLTAAVVATPTTSYANPAVVFGAMASAGPIALGREALLPYVLAEVAGALIALLLVQALYPQRKAAL